MAPDKPATHDGGGNKALLCAVPAAARVLMDVGCGEGALGARLKAADRRRVVLGIEQEPAAAARAEQRLDRVFCLDVAGQDPPLPPGSVDCILYGDVVERLADPEAVLARHRRLLSPGGCILCAVANFQHHALVAALMRSDFPYPTQRRYFTYSAFFKLLLDAGFVPDLVGSVRSPCPRAFLAAAVPLLQYLGLHPGRTEQYLGASQYVFRGTLLPHLEAAPEEPLSFVVCVSDEEILRANLLRSPCLAPGSPHEVLLLRGCASAADGLRQGLARARHPRVVWVHQDVYLPRGWPGRFAGQWRLAEQTYGTPGVVGVYGAARRGGTLLRAGRVVDRDRLLQEAAPLPAAVDTLDELLLAVPRDTPLAADPRLGFHLYGADLCLAARRRGLPVVAVDALCLHNSLTAALPPAFHTSAEVLAHKWPGELPIATSCGLIGRGATTGVPPFAARPTGGTPVATGATRR
jgi:SAM-dependent methyltransferase